MPTFFMDAQLLPPVMQLDMGDSGTYSGSGQAVNNIITSPADGAAQSAYNFYRGFTNSSEASDPTFNGVAGAKTSSEFFSFDGTNDIMTLAGANTTFIDSFHRDSAQFSILMWIRTPTSYGGSDHALLGTGEGGGLSVQGFDFGIRNAGNLGFRQNVPGSITLRNTTATMTNATDYFVAITEDETNGTNGMSLYINSAVEHMSGVWSTPSTNSASSVATIGAWGQTAASTIVVGAGFRLYQMYLFNRKLPDGQVQGYYQRYRSRYGLP